MIRSLLAVILLLSSCTVPAQDTARTWRFGAYSFHSGYCGSNTSTTILRDADTLYYRCAGDGTGYIIVDTISLNNDRRPDFAYVYMMEEYAVIGLLVSHPRGGYKNIDISYVFEFEPSLYKVAMPLDGVIAPMALWDIDGDGRRDMIIAGLDKKKGYTIPGYTQTINYTRLRSIAHGMVKPKVKKAGSGKRGR